MDTSINEVVGLGRIAPLFLCRRMMGGLGKGANPMRRNLLWKSVGYGRGVSDLVISDLR